MSFNEQGSRQREADRRFSLTSEQRLWEDEMRKLRNLDRALSTLRRRWMKQATGFVFVSLAAVVSGEILSSPSTAKVLQATVGACLLVVAVWMGVRLHRLRANRQQVSAAIERLHDYAEAEGWRNKVCG